MSVKLDMSKVYDKVEWKFLEQVMLRLGFDSRLISSVLSCVSLVSYKILLNGRGYPHHDPLG